MLSLLHLLASAELDVKVEAARKVLTTLYMRPTAAAAFAKQVSLKCFLFLITGLKLSDLEDGTRGRPQPKSPDFLIKKKKMSRKFAVSYGFSLLYGVPNLSTYSSIKGRTFFLLF